MADLTKILLVDDNPKYIEDVLPFYGYEVTCALDGHQAIKILESGGCFDLILLDVMMPNMNGWETLKVIRNTPSYENIPDSCGLSDKNVSPRNDVTPTNTHPQSGNLRPARSRKNTPFGNNGWTET